MRMPILLATALAILAGWRPTVDNISRFPSELKKSERPHVLGQLDAILPVLKSALDDQGVEFQAARSFADSPWESSFPWPMNLTLYGFESSATGYEGEAATTITVAVNDLAPLLSEILDNPKTYVVRNQPGMTTLTRGDAMPWKPVSQAEFAARMKTWLTRRPASDKGAKASLAQLEADLPSAGSDPMLFPKQWDPSTPRWPGLKGGVRPVVDLDPSYFDEAHRDTLQLMVLYGGVSNPQGHPAANKRFKAFWKKLDTAALKALIK